MLLPGRRLEQDAILDAPVGEMVEQVRPQPPGAVDVDPGRGQRLQEGVQPFDTGGGGSSLPAEHGGLELLGGHLPDVAVDAEQLLLVAGVEQEVLPVRGTDHVGLDHVGARAQRTDRGAHGVVGEAAQGGAAMCDNQRRTAPRQQTVEAGAQSVGRRDGHGASSGDWCEWTSLTGTTVGRTAPHGEAERVSHPDPRSRMADTRLRCPLKPVAPEGVSDDRHPYRRRFRDASCRTHR